MRWRSGVMISSFREGCQGGCPSIPYEWLVRKCCNRQRWRDRVDEKSGVSGCAEHDEVSAVLQPRSALVEEPTSTTYREAGSFNLSFVALSVMWSHSHF
jgi:hypothetical protein